MSTEKNDNTEIDHDAIRAQVTALKGQDKRLSFKTIGERTGLSGSVISEFSKGKYKGNNDYVATKLSQWLQAQSRQQNDPAPNDFGWLPTPSAERIMAALTYAQDFNDVVVVYGGAGISKTFTCQHYQESNPNVWLATMSPATSSTVPALERVAYGLGFKDLYGGAGKIQRLIENRLLGTQGLLIIDEAQHLDVKALDAMRTLHDLTGVGLALVGNETVYSNMTGSSRAAYLDRLFSRIGKRVRLNKPTKADVRYLVEQRGLAKDKEVLSLSQQIAERPGGLRGVVKTLRLASMFAAGAGHDIGPDDITAAWKDLGGF